jgi:predicted DNA-binding transcriptional regulator YafY
MGNDALGKVKRLLQMVYLLEIKPRTTRELAKTLFESDNTLSIRTTQRDIETIREAFPLEEHNNTYALPPREGFLYPIQSLALYSAARLLYHHSPSNGQHYRSALERLAHQLPEAAKVSLLQGLPEREARSEVAQLEDVALAWFEQRVLTFQYKAPNKSAVPRKLEVYFIEISRVNLDTYVIGRDVDKGELRTFKLSRMRTTRVIEQQYTVPADFDPSLLLNHAWGVVGLSGGGVREVRLKFDPIVIYRLQEGGFPGLVLGQTDEKGWLEARLEVGTDSKRFPLELLSWVQSWGSRVRVLAPEDLRKQWLEEAQIIAEYGDTE